MIVETMAAAAVATGIAALVRDLIAPAGPPGTTPAMRPRERRTSKSLTPTSAPRAKRKQPRRRAPLGRPAAVKALLSTRHGLADGARRKHVRNLGIAGGSLGIAIAGAVAYAPLTWLSLPGFLFIGKENFIDAFKTAQKGRIANIHTMSALVKLLFLVNGALVMGCVSAVAFSVNRILIYEVKGSSKAKVIDIFQQRPESAFIVADGQEIEVAVEQLQAGDLVVARAGETIPVDGIVAAGHASIDQRMLTGEAQPAEKSSGERVFALTTVLAGRIEIRVDKAGGETTAAQIGSILNNTVDHKTDLQLWAENVTDRTVLPTMVVGAVAAPFLGVIGLAAFLYSHPKYKTTMASSIGFLLALNAMTRAGILMKDGRTLDLLSEVDTVVFDKTGTLTEERPHVGAVHAFGARAADDVLALAAAAEHRQTHPIAEAIRHEATARGIAVPMPDDASYKIGYGIAARIEGEDVRVGSQRYFALEGIALSPEIQAHQDRCSQDGHSLVLIASGGEAIGAVELQPTVRPEARELVQRLKRQGIQATYIVSGDHEAPTRRLAGQLGIDHYLANTLPEDKAAIVERLQAEGRAVCFVGDGINDSIALKRANVSVSLAGASTVAVDTAQVVLMDGNLLHLSELFVIASRFRRNLRRAVAGVFVPHAVALGGCLVAGFGFLPALALTQVGLATGLVCATRPLSNDAPALAPQPPAQLPPSASPVAQSRLEAARDIG